VPAFSLPIWVFLANPVPRLSVLGSFPWVFPNTNMMMSRFPFFFFFFYFFQLLLLLFSTSPFTSSLFSLFFSLNSPTHISIMLTIKAKLGDDIRRLQLDTVSWNDLVREVIIFTLPHSSCQPPPAPTCPPPALHLL